MQKYDLVKLSNEYLLAKIGVDTAENEPLEVWGEHSIQYSLHSLGRAACRRLGLLIVEVGVFGGDRNRRERPFSAERSS